MYNIKVKELRTSLASPQHNHKCGQSNHQLPVQPRQPGQVEEDCGPQVPPLLHLPLHPPPPFQQLQRSSWLLRVEAQQHCQLSLLPHLYPKAGRAGSVCWPGGPQSERGRHHPPTISFFGFTRYYTIFCNFVRLSHDISDILWLIIGAKFVKKKCKMCDMHE